MIEDLALSLLALRESGADPAALLIAQHLSGGWCAIAGAGEPGVFHTSLALLALRRCQPLAPRKVVDRAFRWLSGVRGLESHWLWQWKFRLFDRQVRFDPSKSGWPWVPGTVSWVAPTALAILAFHAWHRESPRIPSALDMLLDRACRHGGWNAGNSVVFGVELDPHPDFSRRKISSSNGATARLYHRDARSHLRCKSHSVSIRSAPSSSIVRKSFRHDEWPRIRHEEILAGARKINGQ